MAAKGVWCFLALPAFCFQLELQASAEQRNKRLQQFSYADCLHKLSNDEFASVSTQRKASIELLTVYGRIYTREVAAFSDQPTNRNHSIGFQYHSTNKPLKRHHLDFKFLSTKASVAKPEAGRRSGVEKYSRYSGIGPPGRQDNSTLIRVSNAYSPRTLGGSTTRNVCTYPEERTDSNRERTNDSTAEYRKRAGDASTRSACALPF